MEKTLFDRMKESFDRQRAESGKDLARQAIQALYDCGFLLAEIEGRRILIFPSGQATCEQRQAARNVGDILEPIMPEAGVRCPDCWGASFLIGPNLGRRCYVCKPLHALAENNAQIIGRRMIQN